MLVTTDTLTGNRTDFSLMFLNHTTDQTRPSPLLHGILNWIQGIDNPLRLRIHLQNVLHLGKMRVVFRFASRLILEEEINLEGILFNTLLQLSYYRL